MHRVAAIDTARLRLRPYRDSDVDALHRLWTDPDVRRYLWDDKVIAHDVAAETMRASMTSTAQHGFGHWAVCLSGHDELIGFCGLKFLDDIPEVELLYGLAPAYWHRGLATEAAHAMLRFGFETIGLTRIYAITDTPNTASAAVMQRLGMQFEKRFEHNGLDSVRYVITREQFHSGCQDDSPPRHQDTKENS
jgi:ribosomal-protein-alanine N-acetyltransferase